MYIELYINERIRKSIDSNADRLVIFLKARCGAQPIHSGVLVFDMHVEITLLFPVNIAMGMFCCR